jgi:hypothetical protein
MAESSDRASLQLRLSMIEIEIIDALAAKMGAGTRKRDVIELALRQYLKAVNSAGRFVQRSRSGQAERRKASQRPARRYEIAAAVVRDLNEISDRHHWSRAELVRQAILSLGEREGVLKRPS